MDNRQFAKAIKDCGLVDKYFTLIDVDIIFAQVKNPSQRKITFPQFESALYLIADQKGVHPEDIARTIFLSGGPKYEGTKPEPVRLHDDKSLYTGVYARGGPSTVDYGKDLSELCDRSPADIRGIKKSRDSIRSIV
jgi:p25-alpha.